MSQFQLLKSGIDVKPLILALEQCEYLFGEHTFRQNYEGSAHRDTETIFLKWAKNNTRENIQQGLSVVDMPELQILPEAEVLIDRATELVGARVEGRALIVRLKPGGKIIPHADSGLYADTFERFHLCLQSDGSEFFVEEDGFSTSFFMKPGELWWFNHKCTHWAENDSKIPRINLIIDGICPKYRRERVH